MKEKIKVAFIGYNLTCGGAERNIINLAHFLQKKGIQTDIILFKQIIEYEEEYKDILKKLTIIPLLNTRNKIPKFLIPIRFMETLAKLFYVIRKNRYQILIGALEYHPFYFASFFAKLFKIKNILVFHEGIRESSFIVRFVINLLLRVAFVLADKIVCVSEGVGYSLQMVYGVPKEKIIVIYNGVDIGRINQKAEELISPEDNSLLKSQNLIITLGRLVEKKGQIHLIESFKKTQVICPNSKLAIVGKGDMGTVLKKKARQLRLKDVYFLGNKRPVKNPHKYLKRAKLFVLSSLCEGFSNVIIEAMACGIPVIATDCPYGPREILNKGKVVYPHEPVKKITFCKYGVLIPPFDNNNEENISKVKLLAKAILSLLTNNKLRRHYKKMSLLRAQDFTLEKMGEGYYQVIHDLVNN